jgi:hypothetical protein
MKDASKVLPIPKEVWRMVDFIYRNGIDRENLFTSSGDPAEIGNYLAYFILLSDH